MRFMDIQAGAWQFMVKLLPHSEVKVLLVSHRNGVKVNQTPNVLVVSMPLADL